MHRFVADFPESERVMVVAGGVAANQALRQAIAALCAARGFRLSAPPPELCTDNAAMVAWAGAGTHRRRRGEPARRAASGALAARPRRAAGALCRGQGVMIPDPTIAVIGAGAWGTALAVLGARAGRRTYLWTANTDAAARLAAARCNEARLPGIAFPPALAVTSDSMLVAAADLVLLAVPAQTIRDALAGLGTPCGARW